MAGQERSMKPPAPIGDSDVLAFARQLLTARRGRNELLPEIAATDFVWIMLVDLFVATEKGERLSLSGLYSSLPVPKATALRAIARLAQKGLLITGRDPLDRRRTLVCLSGETHRLVHAVLQRKRRLLAKFQPKQRDAKT
jgi:hypothetical protein